MELSINNKNYTFNFGVGFVRKMDENYGIKQDGVSFGLGLTRAIPGLKSYDPAVLAQVLQCAAKPEINLTKIDEFLDDPSTDIGEVFKKTTDEMFKANAVKFAAKNLKA